MQLSTRDDLESLTFLTDPANYLAGSTKLLASYRARPQYKNLLRQAAHTLGGRWSLGLGFARAGLWHL